MYNSVSRALTLSLVLFTLALPLGGCFQAAQEAYQAVTQTQVSPKAVYLGASTVDAIEITATNYLNQKRCPTGTSTPFCRDPKVTAALAPKLRSAVKARKAVVQFAIDHPGQLGNQGLYDAMKLAFTQVKQVMEQNNIPIK